MITFLAFCLLSDAQRVVTGEVGGGEGHDTEQRSSSWRLDLTLLLQYVTCTLTTIRCSDRKSVVVILCVLCAFKAVPAGVHRTS